MSVKLWRSLVEMEERVETCKEATSVTVLMVSLEDTVNQKVRPIHIEFVLVCKYYR